MDWKRLLPQGVRRQLHVSRWLADRFVSRVAQQVPDGALVLDAGAGDCAYRRLFTHAHYVGFDFARGTPKTDYGGLDVIGYLLDLPFADGAFDAVLSVNVLEHVPEPAQVMGEMARVLRSGGLLYLVTPQGARVHQPPYDFYRYTEFGLRHLAEGAGLTVEELEPTGGYWLLMGNHLSRATGYLFPRWRPLWLRIPFWPLEVLAKVFFSVLVPLLCHVLDGLDRKRTYTLGHALRARKG